MTAARLLAAVAVSCLIALTTAVSFQHQPPDSPVNVIEPTVTLAEYGEPRTVPVGQLEAAIDNDQLRTFIESAPLSGRGGPGGYGQASPEVVDGVGPYLQVNDTDRVLDYTVHCLRDRQFTPCSPQAPAFRGTLPARTGAVFELRMQPGSEHVVLFHVREDYRYTAFGASSGAVHGELAPNSLPNPIHTRPTSRPPGVCGAPFVETAGGYFEILIGGCDRKGSWTLLAYDDTGIPVLLGDITIAAGSVHAIPLTGFDPVGGLLRVVSVGHTERSGENLIEHQWSHWRRLDND